MKKSLLSKRWPWLLAAGIALGVLLASLWMNTPTSALERRPRGTAEDIKRLRERKDVNVLFLMIDTLRAERLSSYGYARNTSPVLDRMGNEGVRFARQTAQSTWTKSSMVSLWTGLYPARTGITRYDGVVPEAALMPAEVLRDAGFQTLGLWRNGWVSPTFGFDQGFDVYQRPIATALAPNLRLENPTLTERGTDQSLVEAAVEFLRVSGKQRWFLYLHLMDLHEYIYDADSAIFGASHSDIYDNSILWTDGSIGELLEMLSEMGQLENTIIAVVSDHGEAFLERGIEGHARDVYRESTEVPFVLSFPFRLDPGVVVPTRTQNVDVWPTLYDLLGLKVPEGIDGRSLLPEILAIAEGKPASNGERHAISDLDQNWAQRDSNPMETLAVIDDPHRFVRIERPDGEPTVEFLFDATDDPGETRDRSEEQKETFERLRAEADAYTKQKPAWGKTPTKDLSELELNLLRALGYKLP